MDPTNGVALRAAMRRLAAGAAVICLGGCQFAGAYKGYTAEPLDVSKDKDRSVVASQGTVYQRLVLAVQERTPSARDCFADLYRPGSSDSEYCAGQRNEVISYLMSESAALCAEHLSGIYGKEAGFNIATGSIASFASGLASITIGTQAKTLAALSTFASAERSLVNESVYKNLLTTAIGTKIEQSRETLGKALIARKTQSYKDYRIGDAIQDVVIYHDACSFYKGMQIALAEGTNTNPASKLASLKTEANSLAQQIDTRAVALKMDEASRRLLVDAKGTASTGDPVLKGLVDQLQTVQHEIQTLTQNPAPAVKPAVGGTAIGGDAGTSKLDLRLEDPGNPLATLVAADAKVKAEAEAVADAVKKAAGDKKALTPEYVQDVGDAAARFASDFRKEMMGAKKPGDPANGSIAKDLKAYLDAQSKYVIDTSTLNLKVVSDQQTEVDRRAEVVKKALVVKNAQANVAACEKSAVDRLKTFSAGEVAAVQAKTADDLKKIKASIGTKPDWSKDKSKDCPA
ncbi:MAG: hypothetical protein WAO95_15500 [Burkholderiales bacterium]